LSFDPGILEDTSNKKEISEFHHLKVIIKEKYDGGR
jgi:hypothetical protein